MFTKKVCIRQSIEEVGVSLSLEEADSLLFRKYILGGDKSSCCYLEL